MKNWGKRKKQIHQSEASSYQRGVWEEMWRNFRQNKLSVIGGIIVALNIMLLMAVVIRYLL